MKPSLYLLDAFALIYRAYYAFLRNPRINSQGVNMNALYGFTTTLFDIIKNKKPDYIAVAFEHPEGNFRETLYSEYKAQREAIPEDIVQAIPKILDLLHTMGITALSVKGYEADDVIGALATQGVKEGYQVYMVTPDKDYSQLVSDSCHMLKPTTNGFEEMGPKEVCKKYQLKTPLQMIDYLGLVGDSSDNVPGCKGIGPKSASQLLSTYDTIEEIYNNLDKVKPSFKKKLEDNKEETLLSKKLVTIVTTLNAGDFSIKDYNLNNNNNNQEAIVEKLREYEFRSLIKRYFSEEETLPQPSLFASLEPQEKSPKAQQVPKSLFDTADTADSAKDTSHTRELEQADDSLRQELSFESLPMEHYVVDTPEKLDEMWQRLTRAKELAFDTETTSVISLQASLVAVSLSPQPGEVYYLPIPEDKEEAMAILAPLDKLMRDEKILKIAQNAKFDAQVLERYGISFPHPLFDTLLAHYLIDSERPHNLDAMALEMLKHRMIPYSSLSDKKDFSLRKDVNPELLALYASEDADVTARLKPLLLSRLKEEQQTKLFEEVEMPLIPILTHMEQVGVRFDTGALHSVESNIGKALEDLSTAIFETTGESFNINSPSQVGEVLFGKLAIDPKPKKTKSGTFATSEQTLLKYVADFPIVQQILDFRGLNKLLNTYVRKLPSFLYPDGRIHCQFNQAVTATGRLSSSNPNLQNIPIRTAVGQEIRAAFVASDESRTFLSADYSQIELRLAAHISGDQGLIQAINRGADIHRETAAKLYHIAPEEVSSTQRSFAKTANFGILYGISSFGLSQRLQIPWREANELIDNYFKAFPGIATYMEQAKARASQKGYAETLLGRRRYLPDLQSQNATVRGNAERIAINTPIQGTAADLIKVAMVNIDRRMKAEGLESKMILQIHDELCFDAYKEEVDKLSLLVREEMMNAIGTLSVPLEVSIGTGDNWLLAH